MESPWLTPPKKTVWFDNWEVYGLGFLDADGIPMVDYLQKDTPFDWKVKVKYKSVSLYVFLDIYNYKHPYLPNAWWCTWAC